MRRHKKHSIVVEIGKTSIKMATKCLFRVSLRKENAKKAEEEKITLRVSGQYHREII